MYNTINECCSSDCETDIDGPIFKNVEWKIFSKEGTRKGALNGSDDKIYLE